MDRSSEYYVFAMVVSQGSFAAAAESCVLTPSGVSRKITRLEERMGVKLLVRTTRRLSLTAKGEFFYSKLKPLMAEIASTELATSQQPQMPHGVLRIRCQSGFVEKQLMPLMPEFLEKFKDLRVEIAVGDDTVTHDDRAADIAFRSSLAPAEEHISVRLASNPLVICASPDYLVRRGTPERPENLLAHNCLTMDARGVTESEWMFRDGPRRFMVSVTGNFGSIGTAVHAAALAGVGIARIPTFLVARDIREGRLVRLLADFAPDDARSIYLVYLTTDSRSLKCQALVSFLGSKFDPCPPWENAKD